MKTRSTVFALTLLSLLTISAAHAAPILYGITFNAHQLITINTTTGASSVVGTIPTMQFGSELASFGGSLYALDQAYNGSHTSTFDQVDPSTALVLSSHAAGVNINGEGGMSFRADGTAFITDSNGPSGTLYQCNVTVVNGCNAGVALSLSMDGLAFDSSGTLYGLAQSTDVLYTINTSTAALTPIGGPGVGSTDGVGALTFSSGGTLYGAWANQLYTINTTTGVATAVGGTLGLSGDYIAGIAFLDSSVAVPEPATAGLALCGFLAIVAGKRLRS